MASFDDFWNLLVVGVLMRQRDIKMTYPMLDHLRLLSELLTGGFVILGVGAVFACFKLLDARPVPIAVRRPA